MSQWCSPSPIQLFCGTTQTVLPAWVFKDIHHEVELVLRVCKRKEHWGEICIKYFDAISLGIDFTARDLQTRRPREGFALGHRQRFQRFGTAVGQVYSGEWVQNLKDINFSLQIDGELEAERKYKAWCCSALITSLLYLSKFFTLRTGDLILPARQRELALWRLETFYRGISNEKLLEFEVK